MNNKIEVSIICNAYNHEKYIRDALNGFVCQQTSFPFEVLIHDDASTDKTADIIREYENRYPDLIKPIYQTENQYHKNDGSIYFFQSKRVQGKYVAPAKGMIIGQIPASCKSSMTLWRRIRIIRCADAVPIG